MTPSANKERKEGDVTPNLLLFQLDWVSRYATFSYNHTTCRQHVRYTTLGYKHFCFIVVSELVMPVVIFPCCGDFQCRQSWLVTIIIARFQTTQHIPDHDCFKVFRQQQRFPKFQTIREDCRKSQLRFPLKCSRTIGPNRGWSLNHLSWLNLYFSALHQWFISRYKPTIV